MRGRARTGTVAAGWAASVVALALILRQSAFGHPLTDFAVYRMGGHDILRGHDIYHSLLPRYRLPFTYPPFAAVVFAPLAALPRVPAQLLWNAGNVLALLGVVKLTARRRGPTSGPLPALPVAFGAAFWLEPVRHTFALGQVNLLVVLLCLGDLSFQDRRRVPQGLLIGVAAAVKLTPLIFLPYLLLTRRWRAAAYCAVGFVGAASVGLLGGVRVSWTFWHTYALSVAHVGGIPYVGNQSVTGDVTRWIHHVPGGAAWTLLMAAIALTGLLLARRLFIQGQSLSADCIAGLTGLLVSPVSWSHHFIWIVPALLILGTSASVVRRAVAAACAVVFYAAPIWWVPATHNREFHHHGWQLVAACSFTLALVTVIAALSTERARVIDLTDRIPEQSRPTDLLPYRGFVGPPVQRS